MFYLFQLCTCSRMCLLLNWTIVHCEFICISFSFVHAPVCANCNLSLYIKKKKKKKKERKKTCTSAWVKMPKFCHNTPLSIFSLGKGRESLRLKTLHRKLSKSGLSVLPPACKHSNSDNVWTTHAKIAQNRSTFPQILHLSSNRRVHNLAFYFQFTTPARKLTHRTKFEHVWMQKDTNFGNTIILCYFRPEKCQNPTQKDTNFGNAIILCYLGPENHQIQL